jgi:peptidoglycan/LPS O-acetylase OafA/YrhL
MTKNEHEGQVIQTDIDTRITEETRYFQVDTLKAIMIFLVIFDHIVAWSVKSDIAVTLWERISIPVFLVIMGFNIGKSIQRSGKTKLRELYSWDYFKSRIVRYIIPFLVLYVFSTLIGLFIYDFDITRMYQRQYLPSHGFVNLFIGFLPFWGPGNWFIALLLQSILLLPFMYWVFTKAPKITLILSFAVEISMQLIVFFSIGVVTTWTELHIKMLYQTSILFYLSAVGLGMWFSFSHKFEDKRNFFMWILYPVSLAFITAHQFFDFRIRIDGIPLLSGDYHFLIFPYSAFLFLMAMNFLPRKSGNWLSRSIKLISKSTYHILLTQILGYAIITAYWGTHYSIEAGFGILDVLDLILVWIFFISFGIWWYNIDKYKSISRRIIYYINFFIIFLSLLLIITWLQLFWVPIPLIIILFYSFFLLIARLITSKPIKIITLSIWTLFLFTTFLMTILQVSYLQPNKYWLTLIPIILLFFIAATVTALEYTLKKEK